ncbi:hypothetical protein Afil01_68800 [Actinorhabdospora filicis]|uniref:Chloramphenicol 3-O phosphotransferase n=1 Tax=Actinorhabdospora filicis TaxID=1785913 RepID=A0A9W6WDG5_9ACTN|nr:AAA family ATPase [Actinorhabdospora filicis]GLZ82073.1 hypothetical protein Afil01_68800 [Actinorhabdospora filicis]
MRSVIFLNGASSAGKTTLAKALQDRLPEPYLHLGLDTVFGSVPDKWGSTGEFSADGFAYTPVPDGLSITYGDAGERILRGFHRAVAALVATGVGVIVDEVLLDGRARDDWREVLAPFGPLYVGVHCDLDELERREKERYSARVHGLARWSALHAHEGMAYDLTVDTTSVPAAELAALITG